MDATKALLLLLAIVSPCVITSRQAPTKSQEAQLADRCRTLIGDNIINLPGFVRLIFHDCVGPNGCDGCIDNTNPDNNGLARYVDAIEQVYDEPEVSEIISRADLWFLCSLVAVEEGNTKEGSTLPASLSMTYGRQHCNATSPYQPAPNDAYPSPHGTYNATTEYFGREFGLSANETVALLGAHTLGRARKENSGFNDRWVAGEFDLDNEFYRDIVEKSWVQKNESNSDSNPHWQWVRNETGDFMMLNSDISLSRDIRPDSVGRVTEPLTSVPYCHGNLLVEVYAADNNRWLEDFAVAFIKMTEKRAPALTDPLVSARDDPVTPSPDSPGTQDPDNGSPTTSRHTTLSVCLLAVSAALFYV